MIRTYSELSKLATFEERFQYLRLDGSVGASTFGFDRMLINSSIDLENGERLETK